MDTRARAHGLHTLYLELHFVYLELHSVYLELHSMYLELHSSHLELHSLHLELHLMCPGTFTSCHSRILITYPSIAFMIYD